MKETPGVQCNNSDSLHTLSMSAVIKTGKQLRSERFIQIYIVEWLSFSRILRKSLYRLRLSRH